jgi:hypothetical protein
MNRFLLGVLVGVAATVLYLGKKHGERTRFATGGRVDELSTAALNPAADPAINAGDATPSRRDAPLKT